MKGVEGGALESLLPLTRVGDAELAERRKRSEGEKVSTRHSPPSPYRMAFIWKSIFDTSSPACRRER
jgi:hypothetical protein